MGPPGVSDHSTVATFSSVNDQNREVQQAFNEKDEIIKQTYSILRKSISTFLDELNDSEFSRNISQQIPPDTYLQVQVHPISKAFLGGLTRARNIKLIRKEWTGNYLWECLCACCSSLCKTDSIYRKSINSNELCRGLLKAEIPDVENSSSDQNENFSIQISAAYYSGKIIEIEVPCDFLENPIINITDANRMLALAIRIGSWIRSFFTKN